MQGRFELFRSFSAHQALPTSEYRVDPKRTLVASGIEMIFCNAVFDTIESSEINDQEINDVIAFFRSKKLPFLWWSENKLLEQKGLQFGGAFKGFSLDFSTQLKPKPEPAQDVAVKKVESSGERETFYQIVADSYGLPPHIRKQFALASEGAVQAGEAINFIAYKNKVPAAALTLSIGETSAGLWSLSTLHPFRKQGIASEIIYTAIDEAQKLNYNNVMLILLPESKAFGLFQQIGFQPVCDFPCFICDYP